MLKRGHKVEIGVRLHSVTQFQNQILCLAVCRWVCEHASPCGHAPLSPIYNIFRYCNHSKNGDQCSIYQHASTNCSGDSFPLAT